MLSLSIIYNLFGSQNFDHSKRTISTKFSINKSFFLYRDYRLSLKTSMFPSLPLPLSPSSLYAKVMIVLSGQLSIYTIWNIQSTIIFLKHILYAPCKEEEISAKKEAELEGEEPWLRIIWLIQFRLFFSWATKSY